MCGTNRQAQQQQHQQPPPKRVDPDSWEGDNWTLSRLAQAGDVLGVKNIIDAGGPRSNLEQSHGDGWTPLMRAVCVGHLDVVKFLIQRGSDPLVVEKNGRTLINLTGSDEIRVYMQPVITKQLEATKQRVTTSVSTIASTTFPPEVFSIIFLYLHS